MKSKKKQNLHLRLSVLIVVFVAFLVIVCNTFQNKLDDLYNTVLLSELEIAADYYTSEMKLNIGSLGQFDESAMDQIFDDFPYGGEAFMVLINGEGKVVYYYCGGNKEHLRSGVNMFRELKESGTDAVSELEKATAENRDGYIFADTDLVEGMLFYNGIEEIGWYAVMAIPDAYVERQLERIDTIYVAMMITLFVGIFLFVVLVAYIIVVERIQGKAKSEKLKDLAQSDQLTGLYNKITTEKKIKEFMEENPDTQSMLFVLDIDNFKKINDTMGHVFGDQVLRMIGQRIKMEFRASDIIGRAGGDEFIIFLKNLKEEEYVIKEAEKVERFFKDFKVGDYTKYAATASIGCAVFPRDGADFETLYKAADQALYRAK